MGISKGSFIVKANNLVEGRYRISVLENRILLAAMAQIRSKEKVSSEAMYRVSVDDIKDVLDVSDKDIYKRLHTAAFKLRGRQVHIPSYDNPAKMVCTSWLQSITYEKDMGSYIEVQFSAKILPYISDLTQGFTKYYLIEVARLSSTYAVRFYELFSQWGEKGTRAISIEWIKERFLLEGKYKTYKDFRRHVVDVAVDQINTYTSFTVKYTPKKTGRAFSHLIFKFENKLPAKKSPPELPPPTLKPVVRELAEPEPEFEPDPLNILDLSKSEGITYNKARQHLIREHKG